MAEPDAPLRYYCETCRTRGRGPDDATSGDPWRSAEERRSDYLACPRCGEAMLDLASEQTWAYLEEVDCRASDRHDLGKIGVAILIYIALIFAGIFWQHLSLYLVLACGVLIWLIAMFVFRGRTPGPTPHSMVPAHEREALLALGSGRPSPRSTRG